MREVPSRKMWGNVREVTSAVYIHKCTANYCGHMTTARSATRGLGQRALRDKWTQLSGIYRRRWCTSM